MQISRRNDGARGGGGGAGGTWCPATYSWALRPPLGRTSPPRTDTERLGLKTVKPDKREVLAEDVKTQIKGLNPMRRWTASEIAFLKKFTGRWTQRRAVGSNWTVKWSVPGEEGWQWGMTRRGRRIVQLFFLRLDLSPSKNKRRNKGTKFLRFAQGQSQSKNPASYCYPGFTSTQLSRLPVLRMHHGSRWKRGPRSSLSGCACVECSRREQGAHVWYLVCKAWNNGGQLFDVSLEETSSAGFLFPRGLVLECSWCPWCLYCHQKSNRRYTGIFVGLLLFCLFIVARSTFIRSSVWGAGGRKEGSIVFWYLRLFGVPKTTSQNSRWSLEECIAHSKEGEEKTWGDGWVWMTTIVFTECLGNCPPKFAFCYDTHIVSKAADHGDLEFKILIFKIFLNNNSISK